MDLLSHTRQQVKIHQLQSRPWVVAYSGGSDSTALLLAARECYQALGCEAGFFAIHVHHALSDQADLMRDHCRETCLMLGVTLQEIALNPDAKPSGDSLEAWARMARYEGFQKILPPNGVLWLGHHRDDWCETILYRLMRGVGPEHLTGMSVLHDHEGITRFRPFLSIDKTDVTTFVHEYGVEFIEDTSNQDERFDRNFIRHTMLPIMQARWPGVNKTLPRFAGHCADQQVLLQDYIESHHQQATLCDGRVLSLSVLRKLMPEWQAQVWRQWLKQHGALMPTEAQLTAIMAMFGDSAADRQPSYVCDDHRLVSYRDGVFCVPAVLWALAPQAVGIEDLQRGSVDLGEAGLLRCERRLGQGIAERFQGELSVSVRVEGENCQPVGKSGSRSLKQCLQEVGMPAWLRAVWPMIRVGDQLASCVNQFTTQPFSAKSDEPGWVITWYPPIHITDVLMDLDTVHKMSCDKASV